ncbi:hypothetical protein SBRCBS47491_005617 [Sporothrix bragantina]|uniref:Uncharacterized protein n=1 Tax=Sporothrix bragantina TaxID=671064 RepID=A0ABP0BY20_9PEZI
MPLEVIYIVRDEFRSNWLVDPKTGDNKAHVRLPTGSVADPALSDYGIDQACELAAHLANTNARRDDDGSGFDPDETIVMMVHTTAIEDSVTRGASYIDWFKGSNLRRTEIVIIVGIVCSVLSPYVINPTA